MGLRDWWKRKAAAPASGDAASLRVQILLSPSDRQQRHPATSRKPSATTEECWIPSGRSVTVAGHTIECGLVYVGRDLPSASRWGGVEPALIDPRLPVDNRQPDLAGTGLHYWPSYGEIPPGSRAAYLRWLAGGRSDLRTPIGYVFLFFYGLERRLLADALQAPSVWAEANQICREVERLLGIYGDNGSFRSYASRYLDVVTTLQAGPQRVYDDPPPEAATSWEIPIKLKIGLGQLSLEGKPIPSDWALAWIRAHPEARLRTPAKRCAEEFSALFAIRYRDRFRDGLMIRPNKTKLTEYYRPASAGFGGQVRLPMGNLPDISALTAPVRKLVELADRCCDELDAYSRYLGKNPDSRGSPPAVALLPHELASAHMGRETADLLDWVEGRFAAGTSTIVDGNELARQWPSDAGKLAKSEAVALAQLLAKRGYGIEPDVRFGGPIPGDGPTIIFRLTADAPSAPTPAYSAGAVLLHLAAAVSASDGGVTEAEERHLAIHLETALHLSKAERRRLEAHLTWLLAAAPGLAGIKRRVATLDSVQRSRVGEFLVTVAAIDGIVSPEEIDVLTKIYRLLELDSIEVYRLVHGLATVQPATEPVTMRPATASKTGYAIPSPPAKPGEEFVLDVERVERKLAETAAVSALLGTIFAAEEDQTPKPPSLPAGIGAAEADRVLGLDFAHSSLVRALGQRPLWDRSDLEAVAAEHGLLPDGALDAINEAAIEAFGEPLYDGEDDIIVNEEVLREMLP